MLFYKKTEVVEALTFDELVAHGIASGAPLINGMPWSFSYKGQPVTHEDNDCYLVVFLGNSIHFNRGEMLITDSDAFPLSAERFSQQYERVMLICPYCNEIDDPSKTRDGGGHGEPPYLMCPAITGERKAA